MKVWVPLPLIHFELEESFFSFPLAFIGCNLFFINDSVFFFGGNSLCSIPYVSFFLLLILFTIGQLTLSRPQVTFMQTVIVFLVIVSIKLSCLTLLSSSMESSLLPHPPWQVVLLPYLPCLSFVVYYVEVMQQMNIGQWTTFFYPLICHNFYHDGDLWLDRKNP